jgi:zinc transporter ZupT
MATYAWITLLVTFTGGCLPLLRRWSHRQLHAILAFTTGGFLGAVFLHLLPEISAHGQGRDMLDPRLLWLLTLSATLLVYLLEALVFRAHDHDEAHRHRAVGYSALVGLSVHSLTEGIAFSVLAVDSHVALPFFISTLGHKLLDGFSLASIFRLGDMSARRILVFMIAFAALTPAGMLLGHELLPYLSGTAFAVVTALAAGTFLFVSLCELLPEVFHHREDSVVKVVLLLAGIASFVVLHEGHG